LKRYTRHYGLKYSRWLTETVVDVKQNVDDWSGDEVVGFVVKKIT